MPLDCLLAQQSSLKARLAGAAPVFHPRIANEKQRTPCGSSKSGSDMDKKTSEANDLSLHDCGSNLHKNAWGHQLECVLQAHCVCFALNDSQCQSRRLIMVRTLVWTKKNHLCWQVLMAQSLWPSTKFCVCARTQVKLAVKEGSI